MDVIRQVAAIAGGMLKSFFKHLVLKKFFISITYAGENAEDTAVKYGYFCSSVYPAFSVLIRVAKCKKYAIDISPNFTNGEQSVFDIDISLRIRIFLDSSSRVQTRLQGDKAFAELAQRQKIRSRKNYVRD